MSKVLPLSQQVILITGASAGIGAALAKNLAVLNLPSKPLAMFCGWN
jgi:NADP-dependent 3-hydroxy acid dehydrogenase YdfG